MISSDIDLNRKSRTGSPGNAIISPEKVMRTKVTESPEKLMRIRVAGSQEPEVKNQKSRTRSGEPEVENRKWRTGGPNTLSEVRKM